MFRIYIPILILLIIITFIISKIYKNKMIESFQISNNRERVALLKKVEQLLLEYKQNDEHELLKNINKNALSKPRMYNLIITKKNNNYFDIRNEYTNQKLKTLIIDFIFKNTSNKKGNYNHINNLNFRQLKMVSYDFWSGFTGENINISILDKYLILFINKINNIIYSKNLDDDYLFRYFILINRNYINISKNDNNNIFKINVIINIWRLYKYTGFQINLVFLIENKLMIIQDIKIIGNFFDSDIIFEKENQDIKTLFLKQLNPFYFLYPYFKLNNFSKEISKGYLLQIKNSPIIFPIDKQIFWIWKRYFHIINNLYSFSFQCFGSSGFNLFDCMSSKNIIGKKKKKGIWDKPCLNNKECPFYKANKNYKNNFGGCINGYCQMPVGVNRIGFHFYTNLINALCYNCKDKNNFNCCQDQLENISLYPGLKSPDYVFSGDGRLPSSD